MNHKKYNFSGKFWIEPLTLSASGDDAEDNHKNFACTAIRALKGVFVEALNINIPYAELSHIGPSELGLSEEDCMPSCLLKKIAESDWNDEKGIAYLIWIFIRQQEEFELYPDSDYWMIELYMNPEGEGQPMLDRDVSENIEELVN